MLSVTASGLPLCSWSAGPALTATQSALARVAILIRAAALIPLTG